MELQFRKNTYECYRPVSREVKNQEQTLEVKLPEAMPDIGRVLGAWGQPVLRSKEWRGSGVGVTGGVMAWVLYEPEDGSIPRTVEAWIPFQSRFDFASQAADGAIVAGCRLSGMDARSVSPRKMMLRAGMSVAVNALEPMQAQWYAPEELPEDVQVLKKTYPVRVRSEAGEMTFVMDEDLPLPGDCAGAQKLVYYTLQPVIMERKVMGDKVLFRGVAGVHALCRCGDGQLKTCDFELPFSQYTDLEKEHDAYATAEVIPAVTELDMDILDDGKLRMKAGLVAQYVICDRPVMELVEDAYSTNRELQLQMQESELPVVLEQRQETVKAERFADVSGEVVDVCFWTGHPGQERRELSRWATQQGNFQLLYTDEQEQLQSAIMPWEEGWEIPADSDSQLGLWCSGVSGTQMIMGTDRGDLRAEATVEVTTDNAMGLRMVTGVTLGEKKQEDAEKPSLILCKMGKDSMWEVAKRFGSTVEAICEANGLTEPPLDDRFLLIPVI